MERANLVGNDVVDLAECGWDRATEPERFESFVRRVCGEDEACSVVNARDPVAALAAMFAAKEAAFKLVTKYAKGAPFAHRLFRVDLSAGRVRHLEREMHLLVERQGDAVHALVWHGKDIPVWRLGTLDARVHPSQGVRALARQGLSLELGIPVAELTIVRAHDADCWDSQGPPTLLCRGRECALDLSLSHHGAFLACAWIGGADEAARTRAPGSSAA